MNRKDESATPSSTSIRMNPPLYGGPPLCSTVTVLCLGMSYADLTTTPLSERSTAADAAAPTRTSRIAANPAASLKVLDGGNSRMPAAKDRHSKPQPSLEPLAANRSARSDPSSHKEEKKVKPSPHSGCNKFTWLDAVRAVQLGYLTQMDGRDLARCLAVEEGGGPSGATAVPAPEENCKKAPRTFVYTASQELGATYREDRHMHGNFCRPGWAERFANRFPQVQLDQVVLDYYWIPTGWDASHWTRSFFESTLPDLCRFNLLRRRGGREDDVDSSACSPSEATHVGEEERQQHGGPCVYLPFGYHCFKMVIACRDALLRYYDVSFVGRDQLDQIVLWRGTQAIDRRVMQGILGKRLDQEEVYCHMGDFVRKLMEQEESSIVSRHVLLEYARRIPSAHDIRFIALRPVSNKVVASSPVSGALNSNDDACLTPSTHRSKANALPGRILGLVDLSTKSHSSLSTKSPSTKRSLFVPTNSTQGSPDGSERCHRRRSRGRKQQQAVSSTFTNNIITAVHYDPVLPVATRCETVRLRVVTPDGTSDDKSEPHDDDCDDERAVEDGCLGTNKRPRHDATTEGVATLESLPVVPQIGVRKKLF